MKYKISIFTLLFIVINFTACSNSTQTTQTKLPSWYLNSPSNTQVYLYGTGEADSLDEAKKNALSNMSQNLVVNVQSSINTKTTSSTSSYDKQTIRDIKLKASKINFTNYKVKKAVKSSNSFFVLLNVNRIELFNEKQKELNLLDTKIQTTIENLQNKPKLEQIYELEQVKPTINEAKNLAFVLYAINNTFEYQIYHTKYDKFINQIDILKSSIIIKIISNTNTIYKNHLKSLLNKNNYKTSTSNEDVLIKISNNIRHSKARGWQIAKVSTTLDIQSNSKSISTNIIETIGRSSSSKQNAISSSAKQFKNKIEKLGLNKILFNK